MDARALGDAGDGFEGRPVDHGAGGIVRARQHDEPRPRRDGGGDGLRLDARSRARTGAAAQSPRPRTAAPRPRAARSRDPRRARRRRAAPARPARGSWRPDEPTAVTTWSAGTPQCAAMAALSAASRAAGSTWASGSGSSMAGHSCAVTGRRSLAARSYLGAGRVRAQATYGAAGHAIMRRSLPVRGLNERPGRVADALAGASRGRRMAARARAGVPRAHARSRAAADAVVRRHRVDARRDADRRWPASASRWRAGCGRATTGAWRAVALWACGAIGATLLGRLWPELPTSLAPSEARLAAIAAVVRDAVLALAAAWLARADAAVDAIAACNAAIHRDRGGKLLHNWPL